MSTIALRVTVYLTGKSKDEICIDTLRGKIRIERSEAALMPYGGLAAWSGFLKYLEPIHQILVNALGFQSGLEFEFDPLVMRLAQAGAPRLRSDRLGGHFHTGYNRGEIPGDFESASVGPVFEMMVDFAAKSR